MTRWRKWRKKGARFGLAVLSPVLFAFVASLAVEAATGTREAARGEPSHSARELLAALRAAPTAQEAERLARRLRRLWLEQGPVSAVVIMVQARRAADAGYAELAMRQLDLVVARWPDFAEGWHARAVLRWRMGDAAGALRDVTRALKANDAHFVALALKVRLLRDMGREREALRACERLRLIHPRWRAMRDACRGLRLRIERDA